MFGSFVINFINLLFPENILISYLCNFTFYKTTHILCDNACFDVASWNAQKQAFFSIFIKKFMKCGYLITKFGMSGVCSDTRILSFVISSDVMIQIFDHSLDTSYEYLSSTSINIYICANLALHLTLFFFTLFWTAAICINWWMCSDWPSMKFNNLS